MPNESTPIPRTSTRHSGRRNTAIEDNRFQFMFDFPSNARWQPGRLHTNSTERVPSDADLRAAAERWNGRLFERPPADGTLPAATTFFGQFLAHDISFDARNELEAHPEPILNHRSSRFDLDSLYGGGPVTTPQYYEIADPRLFVIGSNEGSRGSRPSQRERDLQRSSDSSSDWELTDSLRRRRTAIIPDPRNDQNIIISQLHLAFQLCHNRVVRETNCSFDTARQVLRHHYHRVIAGEFLESLCGPAIVHELRERADGSAFRFFKRRSFVPFEFAMACFRFGHSMIGEAYHLNDLLQRDRGDQKLRFTREDLTNQRARDRMAHSHLDGGRVLPLRWTVQWDRFLAPSDANGEGAQKAQAIDMRIAPPLAGLPIDAPVPLERSLPFRTLLRGSQMGLPTGQWVAERVLGRGRALAQLDPDEPDPLWIYVLREAEASPVAGGQLGPVAARIVAETCFGLLANDDSGELAPGTPDPIAVPGRPTTLRRLIEFSGLPITRDDWERQILDGESP